MNIHNLLAVTVLKAIWYHILLRLTQRGAFPRQEPQFSLQVLTYWISGRGILYVFVLNYNHKFGREKRRQLDEFWHFFEKQFWANDCICSNVLNIWEHLAFLLLFSIPSWSKYVQRKWLAKPKCFNFSTQQIHSYIYTV